MAKKTETRQSATAATATPSEIRKLVENFAEHRDTYHQGDYKEASLRNDFLNPFFIALGWDVYNTKGKHEAYRDVILEQSMRVEKSVRAPDYCFRVGGTPKFFVEAKKPAVDIKSDVSPAFQLRRYAWTAKLPLSILTDFEEFAVYDCRIKPDKDDKASTARVMLLSYTDYVERWEEIASIFSLNAIERGSFDKFAESNKKKRGTAEVDAAFLEEIEGWREALAKNLSLRNESITDRELNAAVQLIIDRVIFLRMCEGRDIEPYGRLQSLLNGERVYPRLVEMFHRADEKYNSGLFHFQVEKDREPPDELTPDLDVDDKVLKEIVRRLYYPESPYEFAALPADILGQVYEQFLGKVIRLTAGHRAKIEEKPEVRKAGGVYYTPTYIVDYIVENTVGKLVEGRTPQEVGGLTATYKESKSARPLTVLDPACGSGSFLIVAYQYLLDWYLKQYLESEPEKHAKGGQPRIYKTATGDWRLTIAERKRILLSHIYGVDIDSQAVEVTKLSLLLKVLEGETEHTIRQLEAFYKERALPDLANNVKCGNSLIGSDFYEGKQRDLFDESDMLRINAFDWKGKHGFQKIFAGENPGFDAVIGNPPYIRMEAFKELKEYLARKYVVHDERTDIYAYFIEREHHLLRDGGTFGMIVSNKFLKANYGTNVRREIAHCARIVRIIDLAGLPVFRGATVRTIVLITQKVSDRPDVIYSPPLDIEHFKVVTTGTETLALAANRHSYPVAHSSLQCGTWNLTPKSVSVLLGRLKDNCVPLRDTLDVPICYGVKSGLVDAFVLSKESAKALQSAGVPDEIIRPYIIGRQLRRYSMADVRQYIIYTPKGVDISGFSALRKHLEPFKARLEGRATEQEWYELQQAQARYVELMHKPKIVYPDIAPACRFAIDERRQICGDTSFAIPKLDYCLLSLLNSRLAGFYFKQACAALEGAGDAYLRFKTQYVEHFPIPTAINELANRELESAAQSIVDLHERLPKARTDHERTALSRQIEHTDAEIDRLVYELYGLTEEEIALVEGATK